MQEADLRKRVQDAWNQLADANRELETASRGESNKKVDSSLVKRLEIKVKEARQAFLSASEALEDLRRQQASPS